MKRIKLKRNAGKDKVEAILHSTNGDVPISTLTQDFHTRLDNLLRTLVHARPHFVRCIRSNGTETPMHLDRGVTMRQIRSLQVLETVNLMAGGKIFHIRYFVKKIYSMIEEKFI